MKKRVFGRKLGRERDARRALFRSLVNALLEHGGIKTTKAKAKAVQPFVDRLINTAQKETQAAKRRVYGKLANDKKATKALLEIAKSFGKRKGGYTRIINLGRRRGDLAQMARLEWTKEIERNQKSEKKGKKKKKGKTGKKSKAKGKAKTKKKETKK